MVVVVHGGDSSGDIVGKFWLQNKYSTCAQSCIVFLCKSIVIFVQRGKLIHHIQKTDMGYNFVLHYSKVSSEY